MRSITATLLRAFAAAMAPFWPAGPLPITTRSYSGAFTLPTSGEQNVRRPKSPYRNNFDFCLLTCFFPLLQPRAQVLQCAQSLLGYVGVDVVAYFLERRQRILV